MLTVKCPTLGWIRLILLYSAFDFASVSIRKLFVSTSLMTPVQRSETSGLGDGAMVPVVF